MEGSTGLEGEGRGAAVRKGEEGDANKGTNGRRGQDNCQGEVEDKRYGHKWSPDLGAIGRRCDSYALS